MIDMLPIISVTISFFALIASIIAVLFTEITCRRNVNPPTEMQSTPGITLTLPNGGNSNTSGTEGYTLELDTEDLDCAYAVYADNRVEDLDLEDMETSLDSILKRIMDEGANIVAGKWDYHYFFLYTADLYGDYDLYLIYTKSSLGEVQFNVASGIEVYGMANAKHGDEENYAGERLMAKKYVQLLKELPDYLCK